MVWQTGVYDNSQCFGDSKKLRKTKLPGTKRRSKLGNGYSVIFSDS